MQTTSAEKKYSIGEAAEILGVSIDTLRRWEKAGKIRALRSPGGHRYFVKKDLDATFGQKYTRAKPQTEKGTDETQADTAASSQEQIEPAIPTSQTPQAVPSDSPPPPPPIRSTSSQVEKPQSQAGSSHQESAAVPSPIEDFYSQDPISPSSQSEAKKFTVEEEIPPIAQNPIPQENPGEAKRESSETSLSSENTKYSPANIEVPQEPANISPSTTQTPQPADLSPGETSAQPSHQQSQPNPTTSSIVTENKEGSSTLRKISIFLLIVFLMVNIILIGFYIFVSNQL